MRKKDSCAKQNRNIKKSVIQLPGITPFGKWFRIFVLILKLRYLGKQKCSCMVCHKIKCNTIWNELTNLTVIWDYLVNCRVALINYLVAIKQTPIYKTQEKSAASFKHIKMLWCRHIWTNLWRQRAETNATKEVFTSRDSSSRLCLLCLLELNGKSHRS